MRIASSLTLRSATGLLPAVLLSVAGNQVVVVRQLNSHGPEAPLNQADAGLRLVGADQRNGPSFPSVRRFGVHSVAPHAMAASVHLLAVVRDLVPSYTWEAPPALPGWQ